jgi:Lrp/AsnC family leucine-responsive transcriptional regulator
MKSAEDLDPLNRKILAALSKNARISMSDLARQVHLSRPAVQARVARLEDIGVIQGYHADVRLPVTDDGHRAILIAKIGTRPCAPALAYLRGQPEVRQLWSVAGPHDAMVEVVVADPGAISVFTDRLAASPYRITADSYMVLGVFGAT